MLSVLRHSCEIMIHIFLHTTDSVRHKQHGSPIVRACILYTGSIEIRNNNMETEHKTRDTVCVIGQSAVETLAKKYGVDSCKSKSPVTVTRMGWVINRG